MAPPRNQLLALGIRAARSTAIPARATTTVLRTFGSSPSLKPLSRPRAATPTLTSAPQLAGMRWSSSTASDDDEGTGNRVWTFEEITTLTSAPTPSSPVLIDVREPGELAQTGRIPGALHIPITSAPDSFHIPADDFEARYGFARPGQERELVFYCKAGVRSRAAATIAKEAGWGRVGEYRGSWVDWAGRGGKVQW
ncbi:Rhodanese-like domain-containing protein [Camillea tinctor]|nr:Rhodanese-like domain-containing protein [Camillea tinctor]